MKRLLLTGLSLTGSVLGNGFYIPVQDAAATAKGNAWVATADNPAAVYYNAAGLTQIEDPSVRIGIYSIHLGLEAFTAAGKTEADKAWQFVPQIYGAMPLGDRFVLGAGLNSPFGLSTDWPVSSSFATNATTTELVVATGWLVGAYKINECLSIGGGLSYSQADLSSRRAFPLAAANGFLDFEGKDESLSYTLSLRWEPTPEHAFGLVYRGQNDYDLKGRTSITPVVPFQPASLDLVTPETVAFGYAWRPCEGWSIEANVEWVNWEQLDTLLLNQPSGALPFPFEWDANFIYSLGVSRDFGNGWVLNAGYEFIENSQPDLNFNPAVADADRHWLACGVERHWESLSLALAYQYAFSDRTVTGNPANPFGQTSNGKYKSRFHGLMLSSEWRF